MKVLMLTPQLPYPPRKGTARRNWHLLRALARHHQVHLLSFLEPGQSQEEAAPLKELCHRLEVVPAPPPRPRRRRLATLFASSVPDLARRLSSAAFAELLRLMLTQEGYDAIQVEGLELGEYLLLAALRGRARLVFDEHNAEYRLQDRAAELVESGLWGMAARFYSRLQAQRLRRYEAQVLKTAHRVIAVSEADRAAILSLAPNLDIAVVPNGVDIAYFGAIPWQGRGSRNLVFTGSMDFRPNVDAMVWFCRHILPLIRQEEPQARLVIVGRRPPEAVRRLASAAVVVTGEVEDVRPYLAQAAVFGVPLRFGGGTRFKVLEALAARVPVVSTTLGAEGIGVTHGRELLLADDPPAFAQAVLRLLREPELAEELREAGAVLAQGFDWEALGPRLLEVYQRLG